MPVNVAIFGSNGHQIQNDLIANPHARLVAMADFPYERLPSELPDRDKIRQYETFEDLISDPDVDFVSLCSRRRRDQAAQAIQALRAGKHVYAEKPCAMTEGDLDAILEAARVNDRMFHEMAGTAFCQPYFSMREIVRAGRIGEVIQVIAEKSYPYHENRPQDEDIDGGLVGQNAIHAVRFVEHVACTSIRSIVATETGTGNPVPDGGLRMASCLLCELENGGLASLTANYLNPPGTGMWGYESLKIIGTLGLVESSAGGQRTRLVIGKEDHGALVTENPGTDYLDIFFQAILGKGKMPLTVEDEISPTRWVIRAKNQIRERAK
jgi:predicted dehydrogenase